MITFAIWVSLSVPSHGGIVPLYVPPFTVIFPVSPNFTVWITRFASPETYGFATSGGNTFGTPVPSAP